MECMPDFCPFCNDFRFKQNKYEKLPAEESLLFEDDNLYVIVDISPLCKGHILIISNKHYLSFLQADKKVKKEVYKLKTNIINVYKNVYGCDVLFFEHGPSKTNNAGGCIDHAHIHCIPYKFDIESDLTKVLGPPINYDILAGDEDSENFSYIYIESKQNGKLIYKVDKLQSQFLRKLICKKLDKNDNNFLWQEKCTTLSSINYLKQTIKDLKDKISI